MSTILEAKDGEVYTGYDTLLQGGAEYYCTPTIINAFNACIRASMPNGDLVLSVSVNTPNGLIGRAFIITENKSFTWEVGTIIKLAITISELRPWGGGYSFTGTFQLCVKIPFSSPRCDSNRSHQFLVSGRALKAEAELSEADLATKLILQLLLDKENEKCNCH